MKKYIVSICLGMFLFSSCSNWLDVKPKTTVEEEEVFSRELGFKEALTGVYIKMASTDLYARNLSYGFLDILGQRYQINAVANYENPCGILSHLHTRKVIRKRFGRRCTT